MTAELNDLTIRAARHAALADPQRLRIGDLLTLGDLSPTELSARLGGIPSNLLAHHLNVLEHAGLVTRSRSEADRRRSYVRLVPGALDARVTAPALSAHRVVFVCRANSARSQLAAALWSLRSAVPVASAGTKPAEGVAPGAVAAAERHGLVLRSQKSRALADVLEAGDWVVAVCDNAYEELGATSALHWSVPDPVPAGTDQAFDAALEDLAQRVEELAPRLLAA
ncbi:helix-turn-helix domain-containing protein [Gryllotalpicola sp.]|uniref:arsenate reductase/protein-tyrosine-phosphatase family protein n=1 Tax=Gryllotalpicola sp. TaxID=1932787 RepID=UPI00260C960F|nr:helix-turn-helix domain-containing protein [Gryllotalpicola sp.]